MKSFFFFNFANFFLSGCSTFLKTLACDTYGFFIEEGSEINYQGTLEYATNLNFFLNFRV